MPRPTIGSFSSKAMLRVHHEVTVTHGLAMVENNLDPVQEQTILDPVRLDSGVRVFGVASVNSTNGFDTSCLSQNSEPQTTHTTHTLLSICCLLLYAGTR